MNNEEVYQKLEKDPVHDLHKELFDLWIRGKQQGFVSAQISKDVMGISDNLAKDGSGPTNRPSTSPHFKPGKSYFYPSVKIHKCKNEDLVPGA